MSQTTKTYVVRNIKKVLPVFILAMLFCVLLSGQFFNFSQAKWTAYLQMSGTYYLSSSDVTNQIWDYFTSLFVLTQPIVIFCLLLTLTLFFHEKNAGTSDFLAILPLKESKKIGIKLGIGIGAIAIVTVFLGLFITLVLAIYAPDLNHFTQLFWQYDCITGELYLRIWQILLELFLTETLVFFTFFLLQLWTQNILLGFVYGFGIICVPSFYSFLLNQFSSKSSVLWFMGGFSSLQIQHSPVDNMVTVTNQMATEKMIFLTVTLAVLIAAYILTLRLRLQVSERPNMPVRTTAISYFLVSGILFCVTLFLCLFIWDTKETTAVTISAIVSISLPVIFRFFSNMKRGDYYAK